MSFTFSVQDTCLYPADEEPVDSSNCYVLRLNIHMEDNIQHLRSAGTMQKILSIVEA